MRYSKISLTIEQQIDRLEKRGLIFDNKPFASKVLANISYYRLRAYTYPFQDNTDGNHPFTRSIKFEDIYNLYLFDEQLRQIGIATLVRTVS